MASSADARARPGDLRVLLDRLRAARIPFVLATVVRAERPTSAKPGDSAVVLPDGTVEGFVGGVCAESTVRLEGLRLLRSGESGLLRVTPEAGAEVEVEGVRTVNNPCLSGGTLEIFMEAVIPPMLVAVFGESPVARAMVRVGSALDFDVRATTDPHASVLPDTTAVLVASHGRDEETALRAACVAKVPYVALVASPKRAAAVLGMLEVSEAERAAVRAPAGLDIGARTPEEIALSVFAEIVARRPRPVTPDPATLAAGLAGSDPGAPTESLDPVCGMTVAVSPASLALPRDDATVYFCGTGCREAYRADPDRYA